MNKLQNKPLLFIHILIVVGISTFVPQCPAIAEINISDLVPKALYENPEFIKENRAKTISELTGATRKKYEYYWFPDPNNDQQKLPPFIKNIYYRGKVKDASFVHIKTPKKFSPDDRRNKFNLTSIRRGRKIEVKLLLENDKKYAQWLPLSIYFDPASKSSPVQQVKVKLSYAAGNLGDIVFLQNRKSNSNYYLDLIVKMPPYTEAGEITFEIKSNKRFTSAISGILLENPHKAGDITELTPDSISLEDTEELEIDKEIISSISLIGELFNFTKKSNRNNDEVKGNSSRSNKNDDDDDDDDNDNGKGNSGKTNNNKDDSNDKGNSGKSNKNNDDDDDGNNKGNSSKSNKNDDDDKGNSSKSDKNDDEDDEDDDKDGNSGKTNNDDEDDSNDKGNSGKNNNEDDSDSQTGYFNNGQNNEDELSLDGFYTEETLDHSDKKDHDEDDNEANYTGKNNENEGNKADNNTAQAEPNVPVELSEEEGKETTEINNKEDKQEEPKITEEQNENGEETNDYEDDKRGHNDNDENKENNSNSSHGSDKNNEDKSGDRSNENDN